MATASLSANASLFKVPALQIAWIELSLPAPANTTAPLNAIASLAAARGINGAAALTSTATLAIVTPYLFTLNPSQDFPSTPATAITLTGTGTNWTTNTIWTLTESGATEVSSSIVVNSPTSATWTLATGAGIGSITISDGIASATLPINTGIITGTAVLIAKAATAIVPRASATLRASASISTGNYAGTVLADNPSGFWRLAELSGTVAVDSSTHGNTGTYAGGITLGQPGAFSADPHTSVRFDGASGDVMVPLPATTTYSMEAWVKANGSWPSLNRMVLTTFTGGDQLSVGVGPGTGNVGFTVNLVIVGQEISAGDQLSTGPWHHIVGTFDGQLATVYHNGTEVAGNQFVGGEYGTSGQGHIGNSVGLTAFFLGFIQDVAFYDTRLSAAQVATHYQSAILTRGAIVVAARAACTATATTTTKQSVINPGNLTANASLTTGVTVRATSILAATASSISVPRAALANTASALLTMSVAIANADTSPTIATLTTGVTVKVSASLTASAAMMPIPPNAVNGNAVLASVAGLIGIVKVATSAAFTGNAVTANGALGFGVNEILVAVAGGAFVPQSFSLNPTQDFQSAVAIPITLTGTGTNWTNDTVWTLTESGTTEVSSSIVVNSPTSATWTLATGPGTGTITISDGAVSANLLVVAGEAFSINPTYDIVAFGPFNIALTGAGTAWTNVTNWTVTPGGSATIISWSVQVNSSSAAVWTLTTGPGVGSITLSDSFASVILAINAGAAQLLSATGGLISTQKLTASASLSATAVLTARDAIRVAPALTATGSNTTAQAIKVAQTQSAIVVMTPNPFGVVNGNGACTATAAITSKQGVSAGATATALANVAASTSGGASATLSAQAISTNGASGVGNTTTITTTGVITTGVAVAASANLSATSTLTAQSAVGFPPLMAAITTLVTSQGVAVSQTQTATAALIANPSGTLQGSALLIAIAALIEAIKLSATDSISATATLSNVTAVGSDATLTAQATLIVPANIRISQTLTATSVLTTAQAVAASKALSANAALITSNTVTVATSQSAVASVTTVVATGNSASLSTNATLTTASAIGVSTALTASVTLVNVVAATTQATLPALASITTAVSIKCSATLTASAVIATSVQGAASAALSAAATILSNTTVAVAESLLATASITTGVAVGATASLTAVAGMVAPPSGIVPGTAIFAAVAVLTNSVVVSASASLLAVATVTTVNVISVVSTTISATDSLTTTLSITTNVVFTAIVISTTSAVANTSGALVAVAALNFIPKIVVSNPLFTAQAVIVTASSVIVPASAVCSANASITASAFLTTLVDGRVIAFVTSIARVGVKARCALSGRATSIMIVGPPPVGQAALIGAASMRATPLSVTSADASLVTTAKLTVAFPTLLWVGTRHVRAGLPRVPVGR